MDANQPTDQVLVSEIPAWIRASRAAINTMIAGTGLGVTSIEATLGDTSWSVGTDLLAVGLELVFVTGAGLAPLETILNGTDGQVKIFIFGDGHVHLVDNTKVLGQFYLNQVALTTFNAEIDDVIALINVDGDGGTDQGYWKELFRMISVK